MRNRLPAIAAITVALASPVFLAGCHSKGGTMHVVCDYAMDSGTFTGRLVSLDGPTATFTVTHATPNPQAVRAPLAKDATRVVVRYDDGDEQFLTVGKDYEVRVTPAGATGATTVSSVHRDGRPCSGGTTYADGRAIETSSAQ